MSVEQVRTQSHMSGVFKASVFAALLLLVFFLQYLSGTYQSEFGGYQDEPAHYATAVMVRDYVLSGHYAHPMEFATDYYKHYPKVAFGHWPPLLYAIQGAWMIIFSESRTSVLVELALTTAIAGFLLFLIAAREFGRAAGILSAVLLICLPEIQTYSNEEMAESLLLVTTFQAAIFFAFFLERKKWQDNVWFALFASLAILTKGNGWALVMVPPIAIVLTRDWTIVKRPSFWLPLPLVGILCLPWQMMTIELANRGWPEPAQSNLKFTLEKLVDFAWIVPELVGWAIIALALLGIGLKVVVPFWKGSVRPIYAVLFGLMVAIWVFHSMVPVGVESRKMINTLPSVIVFAFAGGQWLSLWLVERFPARLSPTTGYCTVAAVTLALFFAQTFVIPQEKHYGFTELSRYIESRGDLRGSVILVSSEGDGEGLVVSEVMMQERRPGHTILRANKLLSLSDWNGKVSQQFCRTPEEVMAVLRKEHVRAVVLDTFPPRVRYLHHKLILQAIRNYPQSWRLDSTFGQGNIQLYRFEQT